MLPERQVQVLHALHAAGEPLTANEIAEAVGKTPHTVRSVLLALNGKGMIRREDLNAPTIRWKLATAVSGAIDRGASSRAASSPDSAA